MEDVEMEEAPPAQEVDMGYEDCRPMQRRGSMTHEQEKQRRASIKAIMADNTITPFEKRRSIQHLMDGRRQSLTHASVASANGSTHSYHSYGGGSVSGGSSCGSSVASVENDMDDDDMGYGYGDGEPSSHGAQQEYLAYCNEHTKRAELQRPFCSHYERKCTIIAPCCGMAFGCRICHDECPVLPPKINKQNGRRYHRSASLPSSFTQMPAPDDNPDDTHHNIDRFAIREVICRDCFTRQSSKTNQCVTCGLMFGAYHCSICNLWMSAAEDPYHCPDCGFCRVGGAENFKHCNDCGMCIDKTLYDNHNCKAGKYRSNCPVCQEYLFSSRSASHEMPCGHAIHWACFKQLAAHDSRCPVCKKTAETRERMLPTWNAMAAGVALQPVPKELCRVVNITCNDCEKPDQNRSWHFLGVQCNNCQSFNTIVDEIVLNGEEAHEFIERNRQIQEAQSRPRRRMNRRRSAF